MKFLKNYTSGVAVDRTVARIETLLAAFGAKAIGKNYESGKLSSLTFQIEINGRDVLIRLPANPQAVYDALRKEVKRPHNGTLDRLREQSERTAWRVQQEWLEIELTKIGLNQTEPLQAFLSYVWDGTQTYFERLNESKFKGLLPEKCE
jgi:hypothetical protein